jgi:hypothetical protein
MLQLVATGKETRLLLPLIYNNTQDERCRTNIRMIDETVGPLEEITGEAVRVLDAANSEGIPLRLLGGLAIYLQSSSAKTHEQLKRSYKDLDFVVLSKFTGKAKVLFAKLGYSANKNYNALHGHQRLLFWDEQHGRQVDIFVDRMQMCHNIDFRSRLHIDERTLSLADLILTKLQIVELNEKDMLDTMALFIDFDVEDSEKGINAVYISGLTASDWGLQKTLDTNLKKMNAFAAERNFPEHVQKRIDKLLARMEKQTKSFAWKTRSMVGERVRWYELPEEPR